MIINQAYLLPESNALRWILKSFSGKLIPKSNLNIMTTSSTPTLRDLRVSYELDSLDDHTIPADPFLLFQDWLQDALHHQLPEPNAMTLATIGLDHAPTSRIVLLKGLDDRGFHFYTNYSSRKGREIDANPRASICFLWTERQRQVTARGVIWKLPEEEADSYFASRPRAHQIGAWASQQSELLPSRQHLENQAAQLEARYPEGSPIPRPPHWGGYALLPDEIEFWQGRPSRLHDRIRYLREGNHWGHMRINP
jgi:pyridoxamine 5'-phosphate oxidase